MKLVTIDNLIDFGINRLTGEACAFGRRILCDLNEDGRDLLADFFSISPNAFYENWNTKVGRKPAIASIMLDREYFKSILIFALLRQGWDYVIIFNEDRLQFYVTHNYEELSKWIKEQPELGVIHNWNHTNSCGSRNIHQMSGRII